MSNADTPAPSGPGTDLDNLRVEIDRIDAAMHALLIERSGIIDRLIAIKAHQGGGSAFRPGREAEMMRRLAERHRGHLPLDTVESIWRIIISTFTFLQASYAVHADTAVGDAAMRDCARFHFGFTVPLHSHFGSAGVIDAVTRARGDLGLVPLVAQAARTPWWRGLTAPEAPKVIARLPFVERPDHPAGLPVFVLALPFAAAAARKVLLHAAELDGWRETIPEALAALGCAIIGHAAGQNGASLLIEGPGDVSGDMIADALRRWVGIVQVTEVGSHAERFGLS